MSQIIVDWGSSNFRAVLLDPQGEQVDSKSSDRGVFDFAGNGFSDYLFTVCADWLENSQQVIMSGMVGSRNGWVETPYLPCPVSIVSVANARVQVTNDQGISIEIVPGVSFVDDQGNADVMRGEETQLFGFMAQTGLEDAVVCLPGTHSKWAQIKAQQIDSFTTYLTGEMFQWLTTQSSLSSLCQSETFDHQDFIQGVTYAQQQGSLLNQIFNVRARCLTGLMAENQSRAFLSGLLIGSELSEASRRYSFDVLHLIGQSALTELYQLAAQQLDISCQCFDATELTIKGLSVFTQEKITC